MRVAIKTDEAPQPPKAALSQAVRAGQLLFTSGFGPHDPRTGEIVGRTAAEQTRQTLANVQAVLSAAGATMDDVVKVTVHLADLARDFQDFDQVYREFLSAPYPSRTAVGSQLLGFLVEIDVVVAVPDVAASGDSATAVDSDVS